MRRLTIAGALFFLASVSSEARAQGSVFAVRGLGWAGRPVSSRSAGTGGALSMFDPAMSLNPAALTRFRSVAGWAVGAPTRRTFTGPTGTANQETMRFPLFGFAAMLPPRFVVGLSLSDFLDRTWTLTQEDSILLRGQYEQFSDAARSIGGVSDMALSAGYRLSPVVSLGAAFHYYLGSTRLTTQRVFDNTAFVEILEQSNTDFRGAGVGAGMLVTLRYVDLAATVRLNGRLRSNNTTGAVAHTHLPTQLGLGARAQVSPGIFLAASAQYDAWSKATADLRLAARDSALDVWAIGVGAEVQSVRLFGITTPLRLGYRTRTLPFTSRGAAIGERAFAAGIGFNFARDRTTADFSFESGSRSAGASKETFRSLFVGFTVRP